MENEKFNQEIETIKKILELENTVTELKNSKAHSTMQKKKSATGMIGQIIQSEKDEIAT